MTVPVLRIASDITERGVACTRCAMPGHALVRYTNITDANEASTLALADERHPDCAPHVLVYRRHITTEWETET